MKRSQINKKAFWQKYRLAVYLFLTSIAIIFLLLGFTIFKDSSAVQAVFLNLGTEVGGAVLLFFVVEYIFSLNSQEDVSQQIADLQRGIEEIREEIVGVATANEIKILLNEVLTSVKIYGHENCKDKLEKISSTDTYRFYKTYDGKVNKWIWKVSRLQLRMERDSRRVSTQFTYRPNHDEDPITYRIQASYWDSHFIWISEDIKNPKEIVVDIYPWMHSSSMKVCAGISIRESLRPNPKRVATPCLIMLGFPEELKELEKLGNPGNPDIKSVDSTWRANISQCEELEKIWKESMVKDIDSFMLTGLQEAINQSTTY